MFFNRCKIRTPMLPLGNNSHELRNYTPSHTFAADVIERYRCTTSNASSTLSIDCSVLWFAQARFYGELNGRWRCSMIYMGIYPSLFAFLLRKIKRTY